MFYYFHYFKPATQRIMEINTPNWSVGLVEYITINDIDFAYLWHINMTSYFFKNNVANASDQTFRVLIRSMILIYNIVLLLLIEYHVKMTKQAQLCNGNHRLHISVLLWWPIIVSLKKCFRNDIYAGFFLMINSIHFWLLTAIQSPFKHILSF